MAVEASSLYLLGRWQLILHGAETEIPRGGQRLVALLALRGPSSRSQVAQVLWPDRPLTESKALLRSGLWRAGQSGNGLVRVEPDQLCLGPGVRVDTWALERTAQQLVDGRGQGPAPTDEACVQLLEARELLDGWYDDWVLEERERLSVLRRHALEVLADRRFRQGRYSEALAAAEAASRLDPLLEAPAAIVMQVHLAEGNPALAVRCFEELRARLRRELRVDPDGRLLELVRPYLPASG